MSGLQLKNTCDEMTMVDNQIHDHIRTSLTFLVLDPSDLASQCELVDAGLHLGVFAASPCSRGMTIVSTGLS